MKQDWWVQKIRRQVLGARPRRWNTYWAVMRPLGACHAVFGVAQMVEKSFATEAEARAYLAKTKVGAE